MKEKIKAFIDPNLIQKSNQQSIRDLLDYIKDSPDVLRHAYTIIEEMELQATQNAEVIPFASTLPSFLKEQKLISAVLTNNTRKSVSKYLEIEKFQFLKFMGPIFTRDDVTKMKPDPNGINKIIQHFNMQSELSKVIFIGDSFIDGEASIKAGIQFILVNHRNIDVSELSFTPWQVFSNLSELISFLRNEMIDCVF
jgi:phosphoglycolate phosphatase